MSASEALIAAVRLARTAHIGPVTFQRLMNVYGEASAAIDALPDLAKRGGVRSQLKVISRSKALAEIAETEKHGGQYVVWGDDAYPQALAGLNDCPPLLAMFGHKHLLDRPCVAVVGARNASAAAQRLAQTVTEGLAQRQIVLVSGMARGIDAIAHQESLETGTVAVLGNGIAHTYPKENSELQENILAQGLILCENPPDTPPQANLFPRRNRIIAGLSIGVLVVEAARQSGSLITARLAGDYGREVMAIPGSPLDTRCLGSNNLIREGAHLVESAQDIMDIIQPLMERKEMESSTQTLRPMRHAPPELSDNERNALLSLLGPIPVTFDELVRQSKASVPQMHLMLLELELAGRLTQEPGGLISLIE